MKTNRSRNILIAVLSVVAVIAVILVIVLRFVLGGNTQPADSGEAQSVVISEDAVAKDSLLKDNYPEVNELISKYRQALTEGNAALLQQVYDTEDEISSDVLSSTSSIIEEYQNTACYTKRGLEDRSYFVFIYDDLKLTGITTPVPNLTMVYVKQNSEGNYYIYRGELNGSAYEYDAQTQAYIEKLYEDAEVKDLMAQVYDAKETACAKDEQLRDFLDGLEGETGALTGETEPARQTESESAETDAADETEPADTDEEVQE